MSARIVLSATDYVAALVDEGSFERWDTAPKQPADASGQYLAELADAAVHSGADESVITGAARIGGRPVAVVVSSADRSGWRQPSASPPPSTVRPRSGGPS